MSDNQTCEGACLCGEVRFKAGLAAESFHACHCGMCQKQAGGPFMAVKADKVDVEQGNTMTWFGSSDHGERGFCNACGSSLFWRFRNNPDEMCMVSVASLKNAKDLKLECHIFIDSKPDYYDVKDGLPCFTEAEFLAQHS